MIAVSLEMSDEPNFRLWKHSGNRLNIIILHYKFNTFIAMFLIYNRLY